MILMKKILLLITLAFCVACSTTINTNGPYAGNKTLYATDQSIDAAFRVLDVFMKFQSDNRGVLPKEVNDFADKTRRDAPLWTRRLIALRDAYASAPTTLNKSNLDTVLKLVREAVVQASAYLVEKPI